MDDYLHGTYGEIEAVLSRVSARSKNAIVYIGTAPVHTLTGGADNVNRPVLVDSIADAKKRFGYSDDYAGYTLCEAMHAHLELGGVGPLVLINVLDPAKHVKAEKASRTMTPENGRVTLAEAESVILDTVEVKAGSQTKARGTDYAAAYDSARKTLTITELRKGALGTEALEITYSEIDPAAVTAQDVIGATDEDGINTGVYAVKNVYQETGVIPSFLLAPGFSQMPQVHAAMAQNSRKINGHWDAYMFTDLPIATQDGPLTMAKASTFKTANGYNRPNETVYFPMAEGKDGRKYHLSVLAAANFQKLLLKNDGIPYMTASNTQCDVIRGLYLGEGAKGRLYDDTAINEMLCKNGIASAAYIGGRWALWGCHSADYSQSDADQINVSETSRMMMYYVSNDFQHRRAADVDKPMTENDIASIAAQEQTRLDALVKRGALVYGEVELDMKLDDMSDLISGDYRFAFNLTTTPLAKSMTAVINWTADGLTTYFEDYTE